MLNKILSIIQFLIVIFFVIIINFYYFSDENIEKINKNRIDFSLKINKNLNELPFLDNDTNSIIEYSDIDTYHFLGSAVFILNNFFTYLTLSTLVRKFVPTILFSCFILSTPIIIWLTIFCLFIKPRQSSSDLILLLSK